MLTWPPVSQAVRLLVPYMVAPVPYSMWLELNGSISSDSTIQPNFGVGCGHNELLESACVQVAGVAPNVSHGATEA